MPTDQPEPDDVLAGPRPDAPRAGEPAPESGPRDETDAPESQTVPAAESGPRHQADPPDSRAEQVAEHGRYRQVVDAAYRAAADRAGWAEALPGLQAAWDTHRERYPDRERAAARTGADGSWTCGEHRRLDPEQNNEAGKAHADLADEADREILPALRRVEAADPQRRLAGLEHMVKGEDRLKEKLADELFGKEKTVRQALCEVPDAVRFTLRYDPGRYADGVLTDVTRLKAEGFELIKLKNSWADTQYKGINSQWRVPGTGSRFEMQFHTPQSLEAKELTHQAYERIRSSDGTPSERRAAREFQRRVNDLLPIPPGTDKIKDYPEKTNG